jgi:hypothetical protein
MARPPRRGLDQSPGFKRIREDLERISRGDYEDNGYTRRGLDVLIPSRTEEPTYEEYQPVEYSKEDVITLYSSIGMSFEDDFDTFIVMKSDVEGRGPQFSTRVASHIFVPNTSWNTIYEYLESSSVQLYPAYIQGYMYVTWHKRSRNHSGTEYYGINLADYREFFKSNSKGRDVRNFESSFANV